MGGGPLALGPYHPWGGGGGATGPGNPYHPLGGALALRPWIIYVGAKPPYVYYIYLFFVPVQPFLHWGMMQIAFKQVLQQSPPLDIEILLLPEFQVPASEDVGCDGNNVFVPWRCKKHGN